jgi:very-short-patch-repair endonuclease
MEKKLSIELDGGQHMEQKYKDTERTKFLATKGIRVLRFWNNEVFTQTESVLQTIWLALHDETYTQSNISGSPLPPGEGLGVRELGSPLGTK